MSEVVNSMGAPYNKSPKLLTFTVWAAVADFVYALYPALVFWTLQMTTRKKVGISCLMGLGIMQVLLRRGFSRAKSLTGVYQCRMLCVIQDLEALIARKEG